MSALAKLLSPFTSFTVIIAVLGILGWFSLSDNLSFPTQTLLQEQGDDEDEWGTSEEWLEWRSLESCGLTFSCLSQRLAPAV